MKKIADRWFDFGAVSFADGDWPLVFADLNRIVLMLLMAMTEKMEVGKLRS